MKSSTAGIVLLLAIVSTTAHAASYEVRIKCPQNPNITESRYINANSDLEALNEANRILESNTSYQGKGCRIISVEKK